MDTVLEEQRKLHEERERVEDALVKERMLKKTTVRDQINCEHRMRALVDRSAACAERLLALYDDRDGLRAEEIAALGGSDEFAEFYRRLKSLREHHRQSSSDVEEPMQMEFLKLQQQRSNPSDALQNMVDFTDEEGYGKFLDLHAVYDMYLNLKHTEKVDYIGYLQSFDRLFDIPREKKNSDYRKYLEELLQYLCGYLERVWPLLDQQLLFEEVRRDFDEKWSRDAFPGWKKDASSAMAKHSGAQLDLAAFSSAQELMSLGLDRLKSALMALGLKCGGTLEERARRLFATKGVPLEKLDPSLFAKSKLPQAGESSKQRELAFLEAQVYRYTEMLGDQRSATKDNVERRLARTAQELAEEEESSESEAAEESEEEDDDGVPYNPKNLPLGWDGKPIPYWLYKLHGLNMSYTCEICGNAIYRGPKAYQRHFSEWRHAHGMRCLGIPNTAHFANVTRIADALALWEKIRDVKAKDCWQAENEEEFEDTTGNVVTRKDRKSVV